MYPTMPSLSVPAKSPKKNLAEKNTKHTKSGVPIPATPKKNQPKNSAQTFIPTPTNPLTVPSSIAPSQNSFSAPSPSRPIDSSPPSSTPSSSHQPLDSSSPEKKSSKKQRGEEDEEGEGRRGDVGGPGGLVLVPEDDESGEKEVKQTKLFRRGEKYEGEKQTLLDDHNKRESMEVITGDKIIDDFLKEVKLMR
jgi:hypothetical protein